MKASYADTHARKWTWCLRGLAVIAHDFETLNMHACPCLEEVRRQDLKDGLVLRVPVV